MDRAVPAEQHVGREHAVGVGEPLDPPHELGRLWSPFALDVGRHVAAGPVLGLQGAVVLVDDQRDQPRHEALVAVSIGGLRELRREQEVEVAGRGMARDARQELVLAE